jgi:quinol monooxygenase YgiN
MIILVVTWMANEGHEDEVEGIFRVLQEESRKEPGCLMYQVHQHRSNRKRFLVYEQYRDDAAMEVHRNSPHFQKYAAQELPKHGTRVEGELYNPLAGA